MVVRGGRNGAGVVAESGGERVPGGGLAGSLPLRLAGGVAGVVVGVGLFEEESHDLRTLPVNGLVSGISEVVRREGAGGLTEVSAKLSHCSTAATMNLRSSIVSGSD